MTAIDAYIARKITMVQCPAVFRLGKFIFSQIKLRI